MRLSRSRSIVLAVLLAACTSTAPPPPEPMSDAARGLIDPSIGSSTEGTATMESSKLAWTEFQSGQLSSAEKRWQAILSSDPEFTPALVGLASVAVARDQFDRARELLQGVEDYPAAAVVRSEILVHEGRIVEAAELLASLALRPETPSVVATRFSELRERAVNQLVAEAQSALDPDDRIARLSRATAIAPDDRDLRLALVEALISSKRFAEAREVLSPMIERDAAMNQVQAALAEIEIGEGKYQNAMRRYERLVQRTGDVIYRERLERAKRLWHESTFPEQFQLAVRSPNITREQLAVLLFWKLPSIRFAQNLSQPPIVVDIAEVMGREELIRVLTLDLLPVDRSTRSARPRRTVSTAQFLTTVAKALDYVSDDPCLGARAETQVERLQACGIDTLRVESDPAGFVTGAVAAAILDQIAELDRSAE